MNSLFSIIQYKTRAIASEFMRGLNWDWVKKDWDENCVAILMWFFGGMLLPLLLIPAAGVFAVYAFKTSPAAFSGCWPADDCQSSGRLWFESVSHVPPFQPPRRFI